MNMLWEVWLKAPVDLTEVDVNLMQAEIIVFGLIWLISTFAIGFLFSWSDYGTSRDQAGDS